MRLLVGSGAVRWAGTYAFTAYMVLIGLYIAVGMEPRLRLRLSAGLALLAFLVIVDEIIKEGYTFDPHDIVNPQLTHEKLFLILLALSLYFGWRRRGGRP